MATGTNSSSNPADVANRLQTLYSKKLLPHVENQLVWDQFGQRESIPANVGSSTIRFFRKRAASTSGVVALTEGTPITQFTTMEMGYVDLPLKQRGEACKITDILRAIDLFKPLEQNIETMGEDAALDFDTITRNSIVANPAVAAHGLTSTLATLYGSDSGFERWAGLVPSGTSATDFASLAGLSAAQAKITRIVALGCATKLKAAKVPTLNGQYVAVVCPQVMHDIRQDTDWLTAATRVNGGKALYKRELIELDGIRYVENTNPFQETVYGTYAAAGIVYSTTFLGRGAYGVPGLSGKQAGSSPWRPQIIINDKPDKSDPLNQFVTAGWKAYWNSVLLWPKVGTSGLTTADAIPFCVNLRTQSTFA